MWASEGILTATGGYTSHASVVARGWGKPCVCGCQALQIDEKSKTLTIKVAGKADVVLHAGDWISINGETGEVLAGKQTLKPANFKDSPLISRFMKLVDDKRKMRVLANADTPADAAEARRNGAEGIGLTRTEVIRQYYQYYDEIYNRHIITNLLVIYLHLQHMFFAEDRINVVRRMILARDDASRQKALDELLVYQRKDFEGIFEAMDGLPVTVRLLGEFSLIHHIDK
jgi:pyruvate,orthophosphate dikinase